MKTKLIHFWESLSASFWFLPLMITLAAIGLSFGLIFVDTVIDYQPTGFMRHFLSGGADSARSILSTIAGAMLSVAGVVFSITLVALTLATSQFGPRLLRNFMHDRINQVVLGTYIATFIYCLIILRTVKFGNNIDFVPNLSVLFAIGLAIANIFLLIVFIHHISVSIQAEQVISEVGDNMQENIRQLFPKEEEVKVEMRDEEKIEVEKQSYRLLYRIANPTTGYLRSVNNQRLRDIAKHYNCLIIHWFKPGDYMVQRDELVRLYTNEICDEKMEAQIVDSFFVGKKRSALYDPEFAVHQVVEIAARALSPGINDPYTALNCIDVLTATMCHLTDAPLPSGDYFDEEGHIRVVAKSYSFKGIMDAAFNQIRQYGHNSPAVLIRLMESFLTIHRLVNTEEQKKAVCRHAEMVYNAAKASKMDPYDLKDLEDRYERLSE